MPASTRRVTHDTVAKLWNLCNILKDDGVTYHEYVIGLTYLLLLKMAKETSSEDQLPENYGWDDLQAKSAPDRLDFYRQLLIYLGTHGSSLVPR
jgi:type I restriction enzyme M protein